MINALIKIAICIVVGCIFAGISWLSTRSFIDEIIDITYGNSETKADESDNITNGGIDR